MSHEPTESEDLLAELRSGDPARRERALERLRGMMVEYARQRVGSDRRKVDLDPESLADSVLRIVDAEADASAGNEHFTARLKLAIKHRAFDRRKRKGRNFAGLEDEEGRLIDLPDDEAGPGTALGRREEAGEDEARLSVFLETIAAAATGARERDLIELFVVRGLGWTEIARMLETGEGALKVSFSRAREKVLSALFAPLRPQLRPEDRALAEALLVKRESVEAACAHLACDREQLMAALNERILPLFGERYGRHGLELLPRLAGFMRR